MRRKTLCPTLFLLLGGLFLSSPALGQSEGLVRGVVTSASDGGVLQGANVVFSASSSDVRRAAVTDEDGYYEIRALPPAQYRVRISYVGFSTHQDTVTVSERRRNYNVTLISTAQQLDEVRVEVKRGVTRRRAGLQTVGAEDLGRIPTPGPAGDLASYLQTLPGVVAGGGPRRRA